MQKPDEKPFRRIKAKLIFFLLIFGVIITLSLFLKTSKPETKIGSSVVYALSENENTANFARADKIRKFNFPADSGPHNDFQTEWWYYTGNLEDKEKNHYGFQLTFFRRAITAGTQKRDSKWGTKQIYLAHFTVSDVKNHKFYFSERYARGSANLAGAKAEPYNVWVENWRAGEVGNSVNLKAENGPVSINLNLKTLKPEILQGDQGLSRKSNVNASYYYSLSQLDTKGIIKIGSKTFDVKGLSWLDREWSSSALNKNQKGWDWFSLQLDDKREIMLYQLRLKDGSIEPFSSGSVIEKDGRVIRLQKDDFKIKILDYWKSPQTNIKYPSKWQITLIKEQLEITVTPHQQNQELETSFIYWEGAVKAEGKDISGNGYVELTGYGD